MIDDLSARVNRTMGRGAIAAERARRAIRIKQEANEVSGRRAQGLRELGEAVYARLPQTPETRAVHADVIERIEACDVRLRELEAELKTVQEESEIARATASAERVQARRDRVAARGGVPCPHCGNAIEPDDKYCASCGNRIEQPNTRGEA